MTSFRQHPLLVLAGLLAVAFTLFSLSGIPRFRDATSGVDLVIGNACWFGFLAFSLAFVVAAVAALVGHANRRKESV